MILVSEDISNAGNSDLESGTITWVHSAWLPRVSIQAINRHAG